MTDEVKNMVIEKFLLVLKKMKEKRVDNISFTHPDFSFTITRNDISHAIREIKNDNPRFNIARTDTTINAYTMNILWKELKKIK